MKIAISSTGKSLENEIDPRFGRCPYFLIVEIKDKNIKNVKAIKNSATAQAGGAGITAAEIIGNENPDAIIITNLGPKAFFVFKELKIKIYQGKGKIKENIQKFIDGTLKEIKDSTGPQHRCLK